MMTPNRSTRSAGDPVRRWIPVDEWIGKAEQPRQPSRDYRYQGSGEDVFWETSDWGHQEIVDRARARRRNAYQGQET